MPSTFSYAASTTPADGPAHPGMHVSLRSVAPELPLYSENISLTRDDSRSHLMARAGPESEIAFATARSGLIYNVLTSRTHRSLHMPAVITVHMETRRVAVHITPST